MTPKTPLEHARDLLARGLQPIPIPYRAKKAIFDGWPKLVLTAADLPRYFKAERGNVGVLTGEPSRWIIDIDLDLPRAVELADSFLPHTGMTWGRAGKPRSHRLFRVTRPAKYRAWRLPAKEDDKAPMIVEFRSTGQQTVAPGSTHKDTGEPIVWHDEGEPSTIDPDELQACCAALAAVVRKEWEAEQGSEMVSEKAGGILCNNDESTHNTSTPTPLDPIDPVDHKDPIDPVDPIRWTVERVLDEARINGPGLHDTQTFALARGLRLNAGIVNVEAARGAFDRWWAAGQSYCQDQDPDAAWMKFVRAWPLASIPLGKGGVAAAVLPILPHLANVPGGERYGPKLRLLVNGLAEMGRRAHGTPFAISVPMVKAALEVSDSTAQEWFNLLERERVIRVVDRGRAGANGTGRARRVVFLGFTPTGSDRKSLE